MRSYVRNKKLVNSDKLSIEEYYSNKFKKITKKGLVQYIKYYEDKKIKKDKDIYLFDYIYNLVTNNNICIDLFTEQYIHYQAHQQDAIKMESFLSILNYLFTLCGKGDNKYKIIRHKKINNIVMDLQFCLREYKSLRYHQADTRFYWRLLEVKPEYDTNYIKHCMIFLEEYLAALNSRFSLFILLKKFKEMFDVKSDEKLDFSLFFNNKSKEELFIEEFELIRKQFRKSVFSYNFEKTKTTYINTMRLLGDEITCEKGSPTVSIGFNTMNLYNIFRMFVKKDIWKNKKIQSKRLSENCKTSDYPKYIVSYCGSMHSEYYAEFIKQYFNIRPSQYYTIKQRIKDKNYRYSQIKCEIKNGTILPKFY